MLRLFGRLVDDDDDDDDVDVNSDDIDEDDNDGEKTLKKYFERALMAIRDPLSTSTAAAFFLGADSSLNESILFPKTKHLSREGQSWKINC